jgi:hypothetical protein
MLRLVCRLFAVLSVSLAPSLPAYAVGTLHVLAWPRCADIDLVKAFEKRFGVHGGVAFVNFQEKFLAP